MTLRSFGRAVPIHMDMLRLLGYMFANRNMTRATTDDGKIEAMRDGRQRLVHATGQDRTWQGGLTAGPLALYDFWVSFSQPFRLG